MEHALPVGQAATRQAAAGRQSMLQSAPPDAAQHLTCAPELDPMAHSLAQEAWSTPRPGWVWLAKNE